MPDSPTPRATIRRLPERATYESAALAAILDEALVCHIGFAVDGQPFVIPTLHARDGDTLFVHGSPASRMLRTLKDGVEICVTVTLIDGLVLARSWFHHSVNYRSAVIFGRARAVEERSAKLAAMRALVEHVVPGRSSAARAPTAKELAATLVLVLPLSEASVKIRRGPPLDDEEDYSRHVWAGVLTLTLVPGSPVADPRLDAEIALPGHVARWGRPG